MPSARVVVVHAVTKGEGIARTHDACFAGRHTRREIRVVAEALAVRPQVNALAVHVGEIDVRQIHPSKIAIVLGVQTLSECLIREGTVNRIEHARSPLERKEQHQRGGDAEEDEREGTASCVWKARHAIDPIRWTV
jgi:hypothetical protein